MDGENTQLGAADLEDLSAYLDGELDAADVARVERLLHDSPAWARALDELRRLDQAAGCWRAPAPGNDLAARIVLAARRGRTVKLVRWLAPVGAAAAAVAALAIFNTGDAPIQQRPSTPTAQLAQPGPVVDDAFLIENLRFVRSYDIVSNYETLEAIEAAEASTGT
ncbi:MAG: hypothetical protein GXY38_00230 [Planctomycetes bacterium]|jgi:anti-sigma factor RsiW|nr:hypothetical protein [Planctomycetota bacterium]